MSGMLKSSGSFGRWEATQRYRKWWVGKWCRLTGHNGDFKRVVDIEVIGPPSFVFGSVELIYEDGTRERVYHGEAYKPRKKDVEVSPVST